jgi:hypothetical protein
LFKLPYPDYIKIDVDGIEHLILEGSSNILKNATSIIIEINEKFIEQKNKCEDILKNNDYRLVSKEKVDCSVSIEFDSTYNQIWEKNDN